MAKTETELVEPKLIRLFAGDFERLAGMYPHVSTARIIRNLVRAHIVRVDTGARLAAAKRQDVKLEDLLDE